ncbi:MAG: NAD-dependent DNA ligase LigA, partial [Bacilli bacterium]|nr:NAD-dependent DNA ligase LigA [Bacilli bacterium]
KLERRCGNEKDFVMIDSCPICGSKLEKKEGQVDHYCMNPNCPARHTETLVHFASREAMNIDGLGEAIIQDFFNLGFIKSIVDIYHLEDHKEEIIELEGYGHKSVDHLLDAIENSKKNSLEKLLFGLGIPGIGDKTALALARNYKTLENLSRKTVDELTVQKDIGPILAQNIYDYFQDEKNQILIEELRDVGLNMEFLGEAIKESTLISGKRFVVTGTISFMGRDEIERIIENYGGQASSSVSKKTDVVIVGEKAGSKEVKARELGIPIWDEEKLYSVFKDLGEV